MLSLSSSALFSATPKRSKGISVLQITQPERFLFVTLYKLIKTSERIYKNETKAIGRAV